MTDAEFDQFVEEKCSGRNGRAQNTEYSDSREKKMGHPPARSAQHQRMAQTSDGYTLYEQADGTWTDTPRSEDCDMSYASIDELFTADPELIVDGKPYSQLAGERERAVGGSTPLHRPSGP